jgi:exodeoxyribonuclease VII small subunit
MADQPKKISFEQGYERLKEIAARLDEQEVPVSELCELFAEGKGLERALLDYLEEQKGRLEEIEQGKGIPRFKVVANGGEGGVEEVEEVDEDPEDGGWVEPPPDFLED